MLTMRSTRGDPLALAALPLPLLLVRLRNSRLRGDRPPDGLLSDANYQRRSRSTQERAGHKTSIQRASQCREDNSQKPSAQPVSTVHCRADHRACVSFEFVLQDVRALAPI